VNPLLSPARHKQMQFLTANLKKHAGEWRRHEKDRDAHSCGAWSLPAPGSSGSSKGRARTPEHVQALTKREPRYLVGVGPVTFKNILDRAAGAASS